MATKNIPLTQEYIKSILDYNPETGIFTWKSRNDIPPSANARLRGTQAGTRAASEYVNIKINQIRYGSHIVAWAYMTGEWPKEEIDHRDNIRDNNRFKNLREATRSQNKCNTPIRRHNKTGLKGVSIHGDKWYARIRINNTQMYLGIFDTPEDAHNAYAQASKKLHGEFGKIE